MSKENNNSTIGANFTITLLTVFVVLKLTNNIDWNWWWVLSPLWIPFALLFLVTVLEGLLNFTNNITKLNKKQKNENQNRNNNSTWNPFTNGSDDYLNR